MFSPANFPRLRYIYIFANNTCRFHAHHYNSIIAHSYIAIFNAQNFVMLSVNQYQFFCQAFWSINDYGVCAVSHLVDLKETENLKGKALVYLSLLSAKALFSTAVYMQKPF